MGYFYINTQITIVHTCRYFQMKSHVVQNFQIHNYTTSSSPFHISVITITYLSLPYNNSMLDFPESYEYNYI